MTPLDPLVAELVARLGTDLREAFEERAAIIEFEAKLPRPQAETLALLNVLRCHPAALLGLRAVHVHLPGREYVFLAADDVVVADRLGVANVTSIEEADLGEIVKQRFGGLALVTRAA
jgi:hypothetical protein